MDSTGTFDHRGILTPGACGTQFQIARHLPAAELAFFVDRYWIVRWDLRGQPPYPQETLPYPCIHMVFRAGASAIRGVITRRFQVLLEGKGQVFGVKLRPGAFFPFVGSPVSELTDGTLPLSRVFGPEAEGLAAAVLASEDDQAQIALVEAALRPRLPARDPLVETVAGIVALAASCHEMNRAEDLATRAGLPLRSLQRLFRRYVGVSPKWVLRRFRMHEAASRSALGTGIDWAAVAHDLGYFDQSHFIKDFQDQVGRSPAEYMTLCAARTKG